MFLCSDNRVCNRNGHYALFDKESVSIGLILDIPEDKGLILPLGIRIGSLLFTDCEITITIHGLLPGFD